MKELLEEIFNAGIMNGGVEGFYPPFELWYEQNKSKIDNILEKQKVKTSDAMINLLEIMVRNQSDINWKQALLQQVSKLKPVKL